MALENVYTTILILFQRTCFFIYFDLAKIRKMDVLIHMNGFRVVLVFFFIKFSHKCKGILIILPQIFTYITLVTFN